MTKAFCTHCGTQYNNLEWPRTCNECGITVWKNPTPVIFMVQPVIDTSNGKQGLAIAQRAIDPHPGEWAFVGGYVDASDKNLFVAAEREFCEETGLKITASRIIHNEMNASGNLIIAIFADKIMTDLEWSTARTCDENLQFGVMWNTTDIKLCFPIHKKVADMWFNGAF